MGSNRLKLLLVSMLAVLAVSAIASASASAGCYKVKEAGTGHWTTNTCTVVGPPNEYVKATIVGPVAGERGVWCAKVEAGEPSTYEDEKCEKAKVGGGYIKVIAMCYMVAEPKTGNYETSAKCEKKEEKAASEWVAIEKLEKEVPGKPGEWCAKVKVAKTGNYATLKTCEEGTTRVANSEFIRVKVSQDIWQVCQETTESPIKEPPAKYDEHKCNTQVKELKLRKWEWLPIAAGTNFAVTSSGSTFTLTAAGKTVTCKKVTDKGTIEPAGADKATEIKFEECSTGTAGCEVKNKGGTLKTVVVTEIPTKLEQVLIGEEEILVNKFEQKTVGATKEFVTLEFEGAPCAGAGYVTTKVKGDVAAEVTNETNGEVKLTFPTIAIPQTTKLEAFGVAATLTGSDNETLVNGWAFRGV